MKNSDLCHFVMICFICNVKGVLQSDLRPHLSVLNNDLKHDGDLLDSVHFFIIVIKKLDLVLLKKQCVGIPLAFIVFLPRKIFSQVL